MSSKDSKRWKIAAPSAAKSVPLKMAEPTHRKVPIGASTGASIREFELSPLQMVKEICLFYVKKCSGRYENNQVAARYVHQMAEEIITQLSGVAGEIKRCKGEPELYQALLDEWNENFPPSLGAMGSPKAIAALVSTQSTQISDLRAALESERGKREKDVSEILRSMDAQLQAYKSSVMNERRHQYLVEQQQREEFEVQIFNLQEEQRAAIEHLGDEYAKESKSANASFQDQIHEANATIEELQKIIETDRKRMQTEVDLIVRSRDKQFSKLEDKYLKLKDKYLEVVASLNEEFSVLSEPTLLEDDDDSDDDVEESEGTVSLEDRFRKERRHEKQQDREEHARRLSDRKREKEEKERLRMEKKIRQAELLQRLKDSPVGKNSSDVSFVEIKQGGKITSRGVSVEPNSEIYRQLKQVPRFFLGLFNAKK
jgi:hypothetical protein